MKKKVIIKQQDQKVGEARHLFELISKYHVSPIYAMNIWMGKRTTYTNAKQETYTFEIQEEKDS